MTKAKKTMNQMIMKVTMIFENLFGGRLMVGLQILVLHIGVRIPAPEQFTLPPIAP